MTKLTRLPKPIRRTVNPNFGGQHCIFDTLAEMPDPNGGMMRLDRDKLGSVTTYYLRWGIDAQGIAKGGGQPYKRARKALTDWNDVSARAAARLAGKSGL